MTAARPTCGADHARRIDWTDYGISATDVLDAVGAVATFRTVPEVLG